MNRKTLPWVGWAAILAVVLIQSGCSKGGTVYEDRGAPKASPVGASSGTTQASETAAGATVTSASAETKHEFSAEQKQAMAQAGHALPAPPKDRPRLGKDVATVEREITGVVITVPQVWKETPKDQLPALRLAQFAIPPAQGSDKAAELVAYNFGPGQGGSVLANVQRWLKQVESDPAAGPTLYQATTNGLTVTEVYVEGTLLPSTMGVGPSSPQPDSALYGIIIEGAPTGNVFLKTTGDKAAVKAALPALVNLVASVKAASAPK